MDRNKVFVVGGDSSLRGFDFSRLRDVDTIVVNRAIFDVPNPNYFITCDFTFLRKINRGQFRTIKVPKFFVVKRSCKSLREVAGRIVDTRFNLVYDLQDFDVIIKSYKESGIGLQFNNFRSGGDSGFCALQLAVILGYENIYLLGIDLVCGNNTHYHKGYGEGPQTFQRKLDGYYHEFEKGLKELNSVLPSTKVFPVRRLVG